MNRFACTRLAIVLLALALTGHRASAHVSSIEDHGHQEGQTYTTLSFGQQEIFLLYTVPQYLASEHYGVTDAEDFLEQLLSSLAIDNDHNPCPVTHIEANEYSAINAFQYELRYACDNTLGNIHFEYLLFDDQAFHTNQVEFRIGQHTSVVEMGHILLKAEIPIELILRERGWQLPDEPAPLKGKVPSILDYFVLGFEHVLTGYDHMAFLLGLMIVVSRLKTLILLITCFTIAHSITLALSGLDIATIPVALTEAAIAVTIIYIGFENLWYLGWNNTNGGFTTQRRWIVTFIFGLIHGFGFSFILREIGLSQNEFVPALLLFNLGVEAAQITAVILPFLLIRQLLIKLPAWRVMSITLSAAIGLLGVYWLVERIAPPWPYL
ncbi:MAG: HupE/UreJ family protein [Pseudomonadales bacterium]